MTILQLPFLRYAVIAGLLAGTALALLGPFVLSRRAAFSGLAASQLAALGAVLCLSLGFHHVGAFGAALLFVSAGALVTAWLERRGSVPGEAWTACAYILAAGGALLVLAKAPMGEAHSMTVFFGNLLAVEPAALRGCALVLAATAGVLLWKRHVWLWLFFDPLSAETAGVRAGRWNALFLGLFALVMTTSIEVFGVLLSFAYLLLPATVGLSRARSVRGLFAWAAGTAMLATIAGVWLSFALDLPTGPLIAVLMGGAALAAGLIRQPGG